MFHSSLNDTSKRPRYPKCTGAEKVAPGSWLPLPLLNLCEGCP
jgi:hypothetical protein